MKRPAHLISGARAETIARNWLEQQGLSCVTMNYRCKVGEIDLIMRERRCLVFIEVRYRVSSSHGGPLASITRAKQQRILRAAQVFLMQQRAWRHGAVRFDAIGMTGTLDEPTIEWRKRAFDADVSG